MQLTMTLPDAPTITAIATLVAALFTGVVSLVNAIFAWRRSVQLRQKVEEVHTDTKQTVTNTNGQLMTAHAENKALAETVRLLQEQIVKLTPRPPRSTDPVAPSPAGSSAPGSGSVAVAERDRL
jgi:translation initiation factor IF-1